MIINFLKVAWRNIIRNKSFSLINILGLALGLTCSLFIFLWVKDERGMDNFHKNGDQLFQIYERNFYDGKVDAGYPTQGLLAQELKRTVPGIQYAVGFDYAAAPGTQNAFAANEKVAKMGGMFAGEDFFKMFTFPVITGDPKTALNDPSVIAISRKMADVFFGSAEKAIGQTLRYDNSEDLLVTAVFENVPGNSSLHFDFLRSWKDFIKQNDWVNNWGNNSPQTFIQLHKDADAAKIESNIKEFIANYKQQTSAMRTELAMQPFTERYLYSNLKNGYISGGRIEYVRLFTVIAFFILLIACINFMNLATARSARRAKEVGIRKVVGAGKAILVGQFIGEALLLTFLSILIALGLITMFLPAFNELTGKQLALPANSLSFWLTIGGLMTLTAIVAGSYPAFFMAGLRPVSVLKGSLKFKFANILFRKSLVVFQFALSIILITATMVIYRQMAFIQQKNLGYDRENMLYLPLEGDLVKNYKQFKERVLRDPAFVNISKMRNSPTVIEHHTGDISWPGKDPNSNVSFADGVVGYDFVKTLDLRMEAGRDFSKDFTDTASYILNETAVAKIGFSDPLGKKVSWSEKDGFVVGVIKDFHFSSLHKAIEPLILRLDENWNWGTILVRIRKGETRKAIASLEKICKQLNPQFPFTYQFSDLEYAQLYKSEAVVNKLSNLFAFLAILISCLGLFGLAIYTAEQRKKELGVRKVLGASFRNIISLLAGNFLKPVCLSMVIAFPVAWILMKGWLQNFEYRIHITWWFFAIAGLLALIIAFLTVSYQSIKSAIANPVKSIRTE